MQEPVSDNENPGWSDLKSLSDSSSYDDRFTPTAGVPNDQASMPDLLTLGTHNINDQINYLSNFFAQSHKLSLQMQNVAEYWCQEYLELRQLHSELSGKSSVPHFCLQTALSLRKTQIRLKMPMSLARSRKRSLPVV